MADESLFTTQLPDSGLTDANDGGPGVMRATTMYALSAGTIKGIRWFSTITNPGTVTVALWRPIADNDGVQLASKVYTGTHVAGTWQTQLFDTPIAYDPGTGGRYFAPTVTNDAFYVAAVHFFDSVALAHGNLVAIRSGTDPLGAGFTQGNGKLEFNGPNKFPGIDSINSASFLVDVVFEASSSSGAATLGALLGAASGGVTVTGTAAAPLAGLTANGQASLASGPRSPIRSQTDTARLAAQTIGGRLT